MQLTNRFLVLVLTLVGLLSGQTASWANANADDEAAKIEAPELAKELRERFESDQIARKELIEFFNQLKIPFGEVEPSNLDAPTAEKYTALKKKLKEEDENNRQWLKEVVRKHGWPGKTLVGVVGSQNAWLLVQHADKDREFQQDCLTKMEAMPKGEVTAVNIAYLTDRILIGTGRKQKYGTQARLTDGKVVPSPIDDPEHVDERRLAIGLEPLADYLISIEKVYGITKAAEVKEADKTP